MSVSVDVNVEELQFLCRTLGHAWEPYQGVEYAPSSLWRRSTHLRCMRCTTLRHDAFDVRGALLLRKYEYPEGYRLAPEERRSSEELRVWLLERNRRIWRSIRGVA